MRLEFKQKVHGWQQGSHLCISNHLSCRFSCYIYKCSKKERIPFLTVWNTLCSEFMGCPPCSLFILIPNSKTAREQKDNSVKFIQGRAWNNIKLLIFNILHTLGLPYLKWIEITCTLLFHDSPSALVLHWCKSSHLNKATPVAWRIWLSSVVSQCNRGYIYNASKCKVQSRKHWVALALWSSSLTGATHGNKDYA